MTLKLLALVLPLGLDTFAVSLGLGVTDVRPAQRLRTSLVFAAFEGTMPLVGLLIGRSAGAAVGGAAAYVAIGVLLALAIRSLVAEEENPPPNLFRGGIGPGLAIGLSISLDELAMGFALGLLHLPLVPVIAAIALQTLLVSQLGMIAGARIGQRLRAGAEPLAGVALLALAVGLTVAKLVG